MKIFLCVAYYGKSVVKCPSDPLPPGKAGEPGLLHNKTSKYFYETQDYFLNSRTQQIHKTYVGVA